MRYAGQSIYMHVIYSLSQRQMPLYILLYNCVHYYRSCCLLFDTRVQFHLIVVSIRILSYPKLLTYFITFCHLPFGVVFNRCVSVYRDKGESISRSICTIFYVILYARESNFIPYTAAFMMRWMLCVCARVIKTY